MYIPVTQSNTPLVPDTLPALKVTNFYGTLPLGNIYTYARLYVLQQSLMLSLCSFEGTPLAESRIAFVFAGQGKSILFSLSATGAGIASIDENTSFAQAEAKLQNFSGGLNHFAGADEQGLYWGAEITLSQTQLAPAGLTLLQGKHFSGALYKYYTNHSAFGSSCEVLPSQPFSPSRLNQFNIIPY